MTQALTSDTSGTDFASVLPCHGRFAVLDGWRAISILLVLATHMLPLGPKWMQLNSTAGPAGMSLFFTLSGFLITTSLLKHTGVVSFFIKRLSRIVPLAMVGGTIILLLQSAPARAYPPVWFYYLNYTSGVEGVEHISHFWSLCVEMHFYLFVGVLVGVVGQRGLLVLPLLAIVVTMWRIADGVTINVNTHYRVDEILAGATLALCAAGSLGKHATKVAATLGRLPLLVWLAAFAVSCHPASGPAQYLRPYLGAAVVGSTLIRSSWYRSVLESRTLRYIAEISYALYVIHPASMMGWLGSGETLERYLKRPLCFLITFGLAHLSTFFFEKPLTKAGRRLSHRVDRKRFTPTQRDPTAKPDNLDQTHDFAASEASARA